MAPTSPSAPGTPVGGLSAPPPFEPTAFHHLIDRNPARAAALLAAMRPPQRYAQLVAHAAHADAMPIAAWAALLCRAGDDDSSPAAVIEPATLALMEPDDAAAALADLTPTQRVAQAVAQAAWLADFGYAVTHTEILASWATA